MSRLMSWLIERAPGFEPAYRRRVEIEKIRALAREIKREVLIVALTRRVRNEFVDRTMWLLRYRLLQGIRNSRDERNRPFRANRYFVWLYRESFEPMAQTISNTLNKFQSDRWIGKLFRTAVLDDVKVEAIEREISSFYRKISTDFAVGNVDESSIEPFIANHFGVAQAEMSVTESREADILRRQHFDLPGYLVTAMMRKREFDELYRDVGIDALERLADQAFEHAILRFDPAGGKTFRMFATTEMVDQIHGILKTRRDLNNFFKGRDEPNVFDRDAMAVEILEAARQDRQVVGDVTPKPREHHA